MRSRHVPRISILVLLAAGWCAAPARTAEGAGDRADVARALRSSVRFFSPSASDVAYGPTKIRVSVSPPPDTVVSQVTFYVDGSVLYVDRVPPYEAAWNAGEKMASHSLRAVALFSDGSSNEDAITTRGLDLAVHEIVEGKPIEHTDLLVTVVDREGEPVDGLTASDFRVRDSGDPVEITSFEKLSDQDKLPLSITVLVDRSGSMRFKMDDWRKACVDLLSVLRPIDQVRVEAFSEDVFVLQDFTHDAVGLAESLGRMGGVGGQTRLFRSLFTAMRDMRDLPGRKAIFLLTDGLDTEFAGKLGMAEEKRAALVGALERLASRAEVTVVTVLPGPPATFLPIQKLSAETGGWWFLSSDDLGGRLMKIGRQLLGGYVIGYDVERQRSPDRKRRISVNLTGERVTGWEVRTSLGTYGHLDYIDALKQDLEEGTSSQKARAATELGRTGSERGTEILVNALDDKDAVVREAAVRTLAEQGDPEMLDKIVERIRDDDWDVREAAFAAAVRFGSPAIPYLAKIAAKEIPEREGALRALGAIGDPNALPVLQEAMGDDSCQVRAAAVDGTGFLLTLTGGGLLSPTRGRRARPKPPRSCWRRRWATSAPRRPTPPPSPSDGWRGPRRWRSSSTSPRARRRPRGAGRRSW